MKTNVLQLKGQSRTQSKAKIFKYLSLLAMVLMLGVNGVKGQTLYDTYSDGNFTASPVWGGNTTNWAIQANSDAAAGATGSNTLRLAVGSGAGNRYLSTQIGSWGTAQEWGFWVGRRAQAFTSSNQMYIWLYANESDLTSATVDGYRIAIGDDIGGDDIRLEYIVNGAVSSTVIASAGSITNGITDIGFLLRVTRSSSGAWQVFTSTLPSSTGTGAIASAVPNSTNASTSGGTATNNSLVPATNGYLGVGALHSSGVDGRAAVEFDQVYFSAISTPTTTAISPTSAIAGGAGFTLTVDGTNFISGLSTVTWGGSNRTTTFVSATQLTAAILAADIASVGSANVGVTTTGAPANSNTQTFTIDAASNPSLAVTGTTSHGSSCPNIATSTLQYTITNNGVAASSVVVSSDDPQFVVSGLSSTSIAGSGGTATYNVTFTPTSSGSKSATISVFYNTSTLATTSSLTGTGNTPATAAVTTTAASLVVNTTATLNGNVNTLGVCPTTTSKGFVYSLTSVDADPFAGDLNVTIAPVAGLTTGAYTLPLTGLAINSGYTFKAYVYDGTNYTYGATTTFTTLTVATKLGFGTSPPSTGNVSTNLTTFTVQAQRADNSLDPEYTGTVTLTSTGSISTGASAAFSGGEATFNATQFSGAGTFTLTASSSPLTQITSSSIVISAAPVSIATWNFTTANTSNTPPTNLTVSAVSQGNNNGTTSLLDNGSASSGYTGSSAGNNAGAAARTGALNTGASGSAYFEFTLTPASGYIATVTGISFGARSTGTGPQAYSLRSSADSYASDIATGSISANSTWALESNTGLSSASADGTAITYRIYGHSGTGSPSAGTANWRIDDLNVTGLVTATTALTLSNDAFNQITTQNLVRNTNNNVISQSKLVVSGGTGVLTGLSFVTPIANSNYTLNDIGDFKLYYTTGSTFSTSNLLATYTSAKSGTGITETVPFPSFSQSLAAGIYYLWITADIKNAATATNTIVVNAPTITASTGTVTNTGTATGIQTIVAGLATNVYFKANPSSSSVLDPSNWSLNSNGSTGNDFTGAIGDADINWNIRNSNATQAGTWTLGNNSKVIVGDGTNANSFTINSGALTGTVDVSNAATLTLNSTTIPTLGTLGSTSTIVYGAGGAQAVTTKNYGNLTISGGNTKTISGAAAVSGTLTINGTVLALGSNNLTPNTLTLDGLGTKNGSWGSTDGSATYKNATYFGTTGTGTVTPSSNTAATASFSNITTSQSINYGSASVSLSGVVASGSIFPANGETVSVTINGVEQTTTTTSGNGSFSINYTTSTLPVSAPYTITYAYAGTGNGFLIAANNNTATTLTVNAATNNWIGGTSTWNTPANWSLSRVPNSLNDNITISSGTLNLNINYTLGTGRTLTISGSGALVINPNSSITIAGTADFGGNSVTVQSDGSGTGSIGTISGTLSNATNVTVQRYVLGSGRNWRFLSSPVQSATIADWMGQFYVTGPCTAAPTGGLGSINDQGWHTSQANITYPGAYNLSTNNRAVRTTSIRQYLETSSQSGTASGLNAGWVDVATNTALTPGKGFRAFIRGPIGTYNGTTQLGNTGQLNGSVTGQTEVILNLNGTLNQGAVNTPTISWTGPDQGWNLIGNPYACAYDWANINTVKTQIVNNTIHVFNPGSNGYISYNPSSGGSLTNGIIPSGAAFFVQASGSGQAAVTFNEAAKVTGITPAVVHKGAKPNEFSIKYSKDSTENDVFIAMLIDNATLNNDGYDIIKLRNDNLNLSSYGEDTMQLTLSAIPPVVAETRIKLNVEATEIGTYNFDFKNMDNFQSNITVSLFDRYTNKTTDVRKNTKYTFDMGPGVNQWGKNRFELILNLDKTNVDEFALLNQTQMLVYPNPATDVLNINISNSSFKNSEVVVYNISGAEVLKTNMANNNAQLNIETLSNGVYFVKVSNQNGFNKTVKFVK